MRFKHVKIATHALDAQFDFYVRKLGFHCEARDAQSFTLEEGWSCFTVAPSAQSFIYHYCFLIPPNQLAAALHWLAERTDVLPIAGEKKTQYFDSWHAESVYFYDGGGNLAEFIVRYD